MARMMLVGLFDEAADAERASAGLVRGVGIDPRAVGPRGAGPGTGRDDADGVRSLAALGLPAEDEGVLRAGLRRGGVVVAAWVAEGAADHAMVVFEECGAADLDALDAEERRSGRVGEGPGRAGHTGHDEDIGFATYGGEAVVGRVPREHHDDSPAGLLGRLEVAAMRRDPRRSRARVRIYVVEPGQADGA